RLGPKEARMLAMFLPAAILGRARLAFRVTTSALAPLQELLHLVFQLLHALAQLRIFRLKLSNALQELWPVVHDDRSLP
ncbi:MAG: hypothetical protein ACT4QE_03615, partial [Anaerolineales bacterium]